MRPCVVYANSTLIAPILFTVVYRGYSKDYCIYKGKILVPGWDVKFPAPYCVNCTCKSTGLQCCGYVTGQEKLLCPPIVGRGTYCFWCGSPRFPRSFLFVCFRLNQWMDFDQTCINTLLGGRKDLIRFW